MRLILRQVVTGSGMKQLYIGDHEADSFAWLGPWSGEGVDHDLVWEGRRIAAKMLIAFLFTGNKADIILILENNAD
jgi:hypothetical protein